MNLLRWSLKPPTVFFLSPPSQDLLLNGNGDAARGTRGPRWQGRRAGLVLDSGARQSKGKSCSLSQPGGAWLGPGGLLLRVP